MTDRITLGYVMGYGHSGSTLLDLLLDQHPSVFSLGEIVQMHTTLSGADRMDGPCTCGTEPAYACDVWRGVDQRLAASGAPPLARMDPRTRDEARFQRETVALLRAVREVTGARVLVDNSKFPLRLRRLRRIRQLDVRPIWLSRDPRGVVASTIGQFGLLSATARLIRNHVLAAAVMRTSDETLCLSYEALCTGPQRTTARATRHLGLDHDPSQLAFATGPHHQLSGNPLRWDIDDEIVEDLRWQTRLSSFQRAVARTAGPWRGLAARVGAGTARAT